MGIGLFLGIITLILSPSISTPNDKGVTSSNTSFSKPSSSKSIITAASYVAPYATASSAFMFLFNDFPSKKFSTISHILGILVDPPTNTTSLILSFVIFASDNDFFNGSIHLLNKS